MNRKKLFLLALLLVTLWCVGLYAPRGARTAPETPEAASTQKAPDTAAGAQASETLQVTHHSMKPAGGALLNYTATAGCLRLPDESGKPQADIFFTAYTVEGQTGARPVTFAFNGGPGASSVWLHMGIAGPIRVITGDKAPSGPPYPEVSNPYSWLPWTDLVFIDPVGTGFSRAIPLENAKHYFSTPDDIRLAGEFIILYMGRFDRWRSPKCLAGESYGAMRAAGLLRYLYENSGIEIDGLLLISPALDLNIIHPDPANDIPYMLLVPSYTATAWHHKKTGPQFRSDLPEVLAEAERWTIEQYLPALARGSQLPSADKDQIAARLASLTGMPETLIRNLNLRVPRSEFMAELLRPEGLRPGFMDGRTTQRSRDDRFFNDPAMALTIGPYTAVLNWYNSDVLHFSPGIPYIFFSLEANSGWNWGTIFAANDAVESIRTAMNRNRRLKILATAGYFDLDIPYFATTYIMNHLGIDPEIAGNIKVRFFQGGHMFYTNSETLEEFTGDAAQFFADITGGTVRPPDQLRGRP